MTDAEKIEQLERDKDGLIRNLNESIERNEILRKDKAFLQNKLKEAEEQTQQLTKAVEEITKANLGLQEELEQAIFKIEDLDESLAIYEHEAVDPSTGEYIRELEEQVQVLRKALKMVL